MFQDVGCIFHDLQYTFHDLQYTFHDLQYKKIKLGNRLHVYMKTILLGRETR